MRRRLMLRSSAGISPVLPAEYQQVEYIAISASGPYITTNYVPVLGDEINCRCRITGSTTATLFNAGTGDYQTIVVSNKANRRIFLKMFQTGSASEININLTDDVEIILKNPTSVVNGVNANTPYQGALDGSNTNLWIFRRRTGMEGVASRIYSFLVTNNGTEKLKLIPCYRKSDNVIGMYDTVSGTFYTNAGSGTFVKGDDT